MDHQHQQNDTSPVEQQPKAWQWWVEKFLIPVLIVIIGSYISAVAIFKPLKITIVNQLALPIIVTVNNSREEWVEPGQTQVITLLSDAEFPANVKWKVLRNKNNLGQFIGEEVSEEIKLVDKGAKIIADNRIGLVTYFYPTVLNHTSEVCSMVVNDGLSIEHAVGKSNPQKYTNMTGYFIYAKNSNLTLMCPDKTYFVGKKNGKQSEAKILLSSGSGVFELEIP